MSQAGYTPISLYYSTTASAVPTSGNLANGELAINIVDEKLYFKNSAGTVKLLASNATSAPVLSFQTSLSGLTPSTATSGVVTLAGILGVASGGTGLTAGTSGGILGYTATGTLASSVALTANALVLGAGAGATPTPMASLGTTTTVLHGNASGAPTFGAVSLTADVTGVLPTANGGTNLTSFTSGGVVYASSSSALATGSALTFDGTNLSTTNGATIQGLTVGRGAGAVATNTAVGVSALAANTTGSRNTAGGWASLFSNTTGTSNTGFGHQSVFVNTTGSSNSAFGDAALVANTTGNNNTALGYFALQANTTASNNTAVGYQAGYGVLGTGHTYLGYQAGFLTASGSQYNMGIGHQSLYGAGSGGLTGIYNTAVGSYRALYNNTTGAENTAVGMEALLTNTTGNNNTAIGKNALNANTTASNNTAVGYQAGYSNTTASNNTAVGYQAGYSNTTGAAIAAFGQQALANNTTGTQNTALGTFSLQSNTTAVNNTAVGYLSLNANTTGYQNTCVGHASGLAVTTGNTNTFVGQGSGELITTGSKNSILGKYNGNQGGLDIRTASNNIVLSDGDGNPRCFFESTNGTINNAGAYTSTTANAANMNVGTDGYFRRSTSALKYKQDIRDVEDFDISGLRPVRYKSKCEGDDQTKDHLGLIADEAADAGFEELVNRGADGQVEGFQYERLTVVLLKELQTLRARVAQLEAKGA